MKKIIGCLLHIYLLHAAPECLDNSYHLTRTDHKDYHAVCCNCPCEKKYKILAQRGKCPKCLHFRDPYATSLLRQWTPHLCVTCPLLHQAHNLPLVTP